ncbi:hypothetical protein NE237_025010 [Protea cynaroides]|uniref:Uncharacterized protein n=1 Tax=Protea cynaroides TaxID=273540 RepID=A0A9Q0H2A5_9MAGN|nr:hypothetical protein NE237_025010 [Protea cynaroides]
MDSSQNWLNFSLSNHNPTVEASQLCLFEAFNNHTKTDNSHCGGVDRGAEEDGSRAANLSMLTAGPKLEDFLGSCGAATGNEVLLGQFSAIINHGLHLNAEIVLAYRCQIGLVVDNSVLLCLLKRGREPKTMAETAGACVVNTRRGRNSHEDLELTTSSSDTVGEDKITGGNDNLKADGDAVSVLEKSIQKALKKVTSLPSNCSIYRVPDPMRKIKPEAYTPRMVSIGPFHRHKKHLQPMEAHKLRYLNDLLGRESPAKLGNYLEAMIELEGRARRCYSEIIQLKYKNEFVKLMLIDGCFILELILRSNLKEPRRRHEPILNATWMSHVIKCDLLLLENQLPFFVLDRLYKLLTGNSHYINGLGPCTFNDHACFFLGDFVLPPQSNTSQSSIFKVPKIVYDFVQVTRRLAKKDQVDVEAPLHEAAIIKDKGIPDFVSVTKRLVKKDQAEVVEPLLKKAIIKDKEISEEEPEDSSQAKQDKEISVEDHSEGNSHPMHLLDFIRALLLRSPSGAMEKQIRGEFACTRSATELSEASVKFEKAPTKCLLDITFTDNGVLRIPSVRIGYWTESLLRNLIAFEQSYDAYPHDITYYAAFIDGLIDSPKDVELLQKQGIIESLLGEPEEVAALFNGLLKELKLYTIQAIKVISSAC